MEFTIFWDGINFVINGILWLGISSIGVIIITLICVGLINLVDLIFFNKND